MTETTAQAKPAPKPAAPPTPASTTPSPDKTSPGKNAPTKQQRRRQLLWLSLLLFGILPSVAASFYYNLIAADQYAVEVRFAVRGADSVSAPDLMGMVTGVTSSGSTLTESYILMDYIHNKEILIRLREKLDLERIFNHPNADWLAAFTMPNAPLETFIKYWRWMVSITFDTSSRIVTVEVRTFSPEDSIKLAQAILQQSERVVNELSERARRDSVSSAEQEVARMEDRLRLSSKRLRSFREKQQDIDPSLTAQANLQRLSALETQLNEANAKLSSQRSFMKDNAPSIVYTKSQIKALEEQIALERSKLGQGLSGPKGQPAGGTLSGVVDDYQNLLMEQEFASKAYVSALASLERARVTAAQQQRYLATFVPPRLPEVAIYPARILNSTIFTVVALVLWAIGVLIIYAVRDHAV